MIDPKTQKLLIERLACEIAAKKLNEIRPEIQHLSIATITTAMCITLHDKWDFTTEQINVLLLQMAETYDSVLKNYLTMEDIEKWCKENGIINML